MHIMHLSLFPREGNKPKLGACGEREARIKFGQDKAEEKKQAIVNTWSGVITVYCVCVSTLIGG